MVNRNLQFPAKVVLGAVISAVLATSCSSLKSHTGNVATKLDYANSAAPESQIGGSGAMQNIAQSASLDSQPVAEENATTSKNLANKPQLVKNASLSLSVSSVTEALKQTRAIINQHQGDLLGLQDSPDGGGRHTLSLEIRVPQERLDTTVEAFSKLGTIQARSLTAEDVSNQLVDFEARLRNLRKTESTLLTIMDRSGTVGDVLKVSQELSRVREETERITAQLSSLKSQVAFSKISLTLEEVLASQQLQRPFGAEFVEAWQQSTHSVVRLTMALGKLGVWLIAYTPYWLAFGALLWVWKTRSLPWQRRTRLTAQANIPTDSTPPQA
jgi:hypothetical protein